jgi:2-keto-4-pentenoate hydratase/2-oxohepta-3-ene-1,7-dioic acid hydratase in catechol pathway
MRIGQFTADGENRIGRFDENTVTDVSSVFEDFQDALSRPRDAADVEGDTYDLESIQYSPPTTEENAIFCAAANYAAHAEESDMAVPDWPLVFTKLPRCLVGHREAIQYHTRVTQEIDYEAELAAVIGKPARHVDAEEALEYVAGYTMLNDTSARDLQLGLTLGEDSYMDWFSGKCQADSTPLGPTVVVDEIEDPQDLAIASRVNGETLQDDTTSNMIYSVADLVAFVSSRVELHPGDVISTGTPEGVGTFQDIQLHDGDTVEVEVEDIGILANQVTAVK